MGLLIKQFITSVIAFSEEEFWLVVAKVMFCLFIFVCLFWMVNHTVLVPCLIKTAAFLPSNEYVNTMKNFDSLL